MRKKTPQTLLCLLVLLIAIYQTKQVQAQTLTIDSFDKVPTNASTKHPDYIRKERGYDIYYVKGKAQLAHIRPHKQNPTDNALRIQFSVPSYFSWGNWLSVRRELPANFDLQSYKGLEVNFINGVASADAKLRITLSDLTNDEKGGDEIWWYDFDPGLLKNKSKKWVKIRVPFDGFYLSHGKGARHNDRKLNLEKIIAYEISIVSAPGKTADGRFCINSLVAY